MKYTREELNKMSEEELRSCVATAIVENILKIIAIMSQTSTFVPKHKTKEAFEGAVECSFSDPECIRHIENLKEIADRMGKDELISFILKLKSA